MAANHGRRWSTSPVKASLCSPASLQMHPDQNPLFLPGCSAAHGNFGKRPLTVTNTMMMAYVQMRGPKVGVPTCDPLFDWIRLREGLARDDGISRPRSEKDIMRMIAKMDQVLRSENPNGDSPRDAVFQLERPAMADHLEPPEGMDLGLHQFVHACCDFEYEYDGDDEIDELDEDGNVARGCLSPCTFLAWSKDCKRWDDVALAEAVEDQTTPVRCRPDTPEYGDTPPSQPRKSRWPSCTFEQYDERDGGPISPQYAVPSSPSILWLPEGVDPKREIHHRFEKQYRRMNPQAAIKHQNMRMDIVARTEESVNPSSNDEHYTFSEVEEVINDMMEKSDTNQLGVPFQRTSELKAHLAKTTQEIQAAEKESDELENATREQTMRIRALQARHDEAVLAVAKLKLQRRDDEMRRIEALKQSRSQQEKRRGRIADHVRNHFRDSCARLETCRAEVDEGREKRLYNDHLIATLEGELFGMCFEVGKLCLEEVYEELGGASPGECEFANGHGHGDRKGEVHDNDHGMAVQAPRNDHLCGFDKDQDDFAVEDYESDQDDYYDMLEDYTPPTMRPSPKHTPKCELVPPRLLARPQSAELITPTRSGNGNPRCQTMSKGESTSVCKSGIVAVNGNYSNSPDSSVRSSPRRKLPWDYGDIRDSLTADYGAACEQTPKAW